MAKYHPTKSAKRGTKLEDAVKLGREQSPTCEHYLCNGRYTLSRRAKYLLMFLANHMPKEYHSSLACMFATEPRRNQNRLAELLFAYMIGSCNVTSPKDQCLLDTLVEMLDMVDELEGRM